MSLQVPQKVENDPAGVPTSDEQDSAEEPHHEVATEPDLEDEAQSDSDSPSKDHASPNTSSDLFCGTPQKTNSRRQPFITLEKYPGGKSPCSDTASTFSGPLTKAADSQERRSTSDAASPLANQNSQLSSDSPKETRSDQCLRNDPPESPVRPRDGGTTCEPVRLIERLPGNTKEKDAGEPGEKEEPASTLEEETLSQEENLDDSQSAVTKTPGEPRRSGRHRVKPSRPGDEPKEPEEKPVPPKRTRSQEAPQSGSQKLSSAQSKPNTRKRATGEEHDGNERSRTRAQTGPTESQGKTPKRVKLYNSSQDFLENCEPKNSSTTDFSQRDLQPGDGRSQTPSKSGRKSKTSSPTAEDGEAATGTGPLEQDQDLQNQDKPEGASQKPEASPERRDDTEGDKVEELKDEKEEQQNTTMNQELVSSGTEGAKKVPVAPTDSILSQDDSKEKVVLCQDSQTLRRSRRSKMSSEEETEEKRRRPSRACSQGSSPANSQTRTTADGRGRRSAHLQAKSSPLSTPENSQSSSGPGSAGSSNETGRYSSRRSSQAFQTKTNSPVLESSEPRPDLPVAKKRGRKPKVSSQSLQDPDQSSLNDSQSTQDFPSEPQSKQDDPGPESSPESPESAQTGPEPQSSPDGLESMECRPDLESDLQTQQDSAVENGESQTERDCESISASPHLEIKPTSDPTSAQDPDLPTAERQEVDCDEEEVPHSSPQVEVQLGTETETKESPSLDDGGHQEPVHHPEDKEPEDVHQTEAEPCAALEENQSDGTSDTNSHSKLEEHLTDVPENPAPRPNPDPADVIPVVDQVVGMETLEGRDGGAAKTSDSEKVCESATLEVSALPSETGGDEVFLHSPLKPKDLDGLIGQDLGQSPSSRTRGTWSPSASPSTSILKKGQKRPLEDQTPSPLVKVSRRRPSTPSVQFKVTS